MAIEILQVLSEQILWKNWQAKAFDFWKFRGVNLSDHLAENCDLVLKAVDDLVVAYFIQLLLSDEVG